MSVGWGDTYGYRLEGQSLDITGLADGTYVLRIVIDLWGLKTPSESRLAACSACSQPSSRSFAMPSLTEAT
ncbi:MAG: hypothetical protein GTO63_27445 [Anaerolineae bacterium]|nr:hypothetical protein [Anaerolineae bacterium]NIN98465.1 hypothetical protein [Anaerolineae bacterium]NIQ81362.1 hypothetical protein [Anaerolineae bacterium]